MLLVESTLSGPSQGHCPVPKSISWNTPSRGPGPPGGVGVSKFTVVVTAAGAPRSRTNTSVRPLVSPGTRLVADDSKATKRPSPLIAGYALVLFACLPALSTLTRSVVPVRRTGRYTVELQNIVTVT